MSYICVAEIKRAMYWAVPQTIKRKTNDAFGHSMIKMKHDVKSDTYNIGVKMKSNETSHKTEHV